LGTLNPQDGTPAPSSPLDQLIGAITRRLLSSARQRSPARAGSFFDPSRKPIVRGSSQCGFRVTGRPKHLCGGLISPCWHRDWGGTRWQTTPAARTFPTRFAHPPASERPTRSAQGSAALRFSRHRHQGGSTPFWVVVVSVALTQGEARESQPNNNRHSYAPPWPGFRHRHGFSEEGAV
jgi:hypothetical protein